MADHRESLLSDDNLEAKKPMQNRFDGLSNQQIWAYGVGHFINDLAATCWFNYLLYFLKEIVRTPAASLAILAGQIADGIATPIVGWLSDRTRTKYGKPSTLYRSAKALVRWRTCSGHLRLPPNLPELPKVNRQYRIDRLRVRLLHYLPLTVQRWVGGAADKSHEFSAIFDMFAQAQGTSTLTQDRLNNLRNTFTFVSNFTVLAMALVIFTVMSDPTLEINLISYVVVAIGSATSLFFIWKIDELDLQKQGSKQTIHSQISLFSEDDQLHIAQSKKKSVKVSKLRDWFKLPAFYIFGLCYMGVRLYSNLFGTLLPFYLVYVLKLGRSSGFDPDVDVAPSKIPFVVALIPLLIYLSSVCTSFILSKFYEKFGRKAALMTGGVLCAGCAVFLIFLSSDFSWPIYGLAVLVGMAQSMVLATGINLISEVIGTKGEQGAFVFGIYSLLDKFSAGIAIFFITNSQIFTSHNSNFIRYMTVLVPSAACLGACLVVLFTPIQEYSEKSKKLEIKMNRRKSSLEEELVV